MPVTILATFYLSELYFPVGPRLLISVKSRILRVGRSVGELTGFIVSSDVSNFLLYVFDFFDCLTKSCILWVPV